MAKINKVMVGESLVGDGNEVAHVDLLIGPRGSAVETAFCNALTNNKDGFTSLLAVVAPNLLAKPNTVMFNKVTIKGAKQAVQMFGPARGSMPIPPSRPGTRHSRPIAATPEPLRISPWRPSSSPAWRRAPESWRRGWHGT